MDNLYFHDSDFNSDLLSVFHLSISSRVCGSSYSLVSGSLKHNKVTNIHMVPKIAPGAHLIRIAKGPAKGANIPPTLEIVDDTPKPTFLRFVGYNSGVYKNTLPKDPAEPYFPIKVKAVDADNIALFPLAIDTKTVAKRQDSPVTAWKNITVLFRPIRFMRYISVRAAG